MTDPEHDWIRLALPEFFALWRTHHPGHERVPLGVPHFGATAEDRRVLVDTASRTLSQRGLGTVHQPARDLELLLSALARTGTTAVHFHEVYPDWRATGVVVRGVIAARVDQEVLLAPVRRARLAPAAVSVLPDHVAGPGRSVNVRWADYQRAARIGSAEGTEAFLDELRAAGVREPEARTLLRVVSGRRGGGQFSARGQGSGSNPVNWLDTAEGRYALRRSREYLVVTPVDANRLTGTVADLIGEPRAN
ncbi:ESX secretion-associated protein EspG [Goodfellowiella coeruleoviolacea]|uniref:EspG family protein n=1 Tax=Goodfellowiella coeruleoviolacea TaxID=334858 RepID=A0AAE3GBP3_9PSEU|nr:ESX secretion-associated protein EspG [Goodfellowiella coeruleoviolacea]MCP2164439.1 EspG family protein [Goodfellowiella coeruleoviolacea]